MKIIKKHRWLFPLGLATLLLLLSIHLYSTRSSAANTCGYTDPEPFGIEVCNVNGQQLNYELWNDTGIESYGKWSNK
jgi:hypothetical protein